MIQRADSRDQVLDEIAARITSAMRPWRIVLFGSRARGRAQPDSDYDIFVEVDADRSALKAIDAQIRALFRDYEWRLDLKLAARGDLERRRDDPGTIEWDVAREGMVLFADPGAARDIKPPDRVREPPPEPPESMYEWLEAAERDERHAGVLRTLDQDFSPELCLLSHQASEKLLKALLVARRIRPVRTHDLTKLLDAARRANCELAGLDAACKLITKHAVKPRYPAGLDLGPEDAEAALEAAERIAAAVRAELPPRLH